MTSSTNTVHARSDALTPEIVAAITPTSTVYCDDACDHDGNPEWHILLDGRLVGRFGDDDEDAATQLLGAIEEHIARLGTRAAFIAGLRDLADFLDATPGASLPNPSFGRHFEDADDFDAAAEAMGAEATRHGHAGYEHATRRFGPIAYDVQTNGRAAQQIRRREAAIAAREAELAAREAVVFPQVDASGTLIREDAS